jgi:HEAT repeat protein
MSPISENTKKLLAGLGSDNADVRYAAWARGGEMEPDAIPELARLLAAEQPGARRAADEALKKLVHSAGKEPGGERRAAVSRGLAGLAGGDQPEGVRVIALRHLSLVGGDECVPVAAKLLRDPKLQEEAIFCLERIPGKASSAAIMRAYDGAKDDFKPRILAALGHRRVEEATEMCAAAMNSKNPDIAIAGFRALARIGRKPAAGLRPPRAESLNAWQKFDHTDSLLRYADEQVKRGNPQDALKIYKDLLQREEEHVQCAAIVGLSKTGTPEAAAAIFPKLKSDNHTVRITAAKAWDAMKG